MSDNREAAFICCGGVVMVKVKEMDCSPNVIIEISELLENAYTAKDVIEAEMTVLEYFQLVHRPTVAGFFQYFAVFGLMPMYRPFSSLPQEGEQLYKSMKIYLNGFLKHVSKANSMFIQMPPSVVAASCVVCARICLHLDPVWSRTMKTVSHYTMKQLAICSSKLMTARDRDNVQNGAAGAWAR